MRLPWFAYLAAAATVACYYYQPVTTPDPLPGSYLSATITDSGADHLARTIGPDVKSVRGRLLSSDGAALRLSVAGVSLHHGEDISWRGESVTLNREYVIQLQQRRLARGRTMLLTGATILSVITTYKVAQGIGLIPSNTGGNPPPK